MVMYVLILYVSAAMAGVGFIAHRGQEIWAASWIERELELELHTELRAGKTSCKR